MGSKERAIPAESFPPGEFIRDELEARGWTQEEFASILGRPLQTVNQIINGKKAITPDTAKAIGKAFGTSAELWLNLETSYRLEQAGEPDDDIGRRSRIHSLVPLKELIDRGWIENTQNLDELEDAVCRFLEIETINDTPSLKVAARLSGTYGELSTSQRAWAFRAKHVAAAKTAKPFCRSTLKESVSNIVRLSANPDNVSQLDRELSRLGIRLVFVPHLPQTRIDGATLWIDGGFPLVALSLRFDRIDYFWFTIMHELAHVLQGGDAMNFLDTDLVGKEAQKSDDKPKGEQVADRAAADWLVSQKRLHDFIRRHRPRYSAAAIDKFAADIGVHPGIVVGQLQHKGEVPWTHFRSLLVKVNHFLQAQMLQD